MIYSNNQEVTEFLTQLDHPLKKEIEAVREIILSMDNELSEQLKWNAPSYSYRNEDRVTFNLHGKGIFRIVLHRGAKVKENADLRPFFENENKLLEWAANDRAIIKFKDMNDVEQKAEQFKETVKRWIEVLEEK